MRFIFGALTCAVNAVGYVIELGMMTTGSQATRDFLINRNIKNLKK